MTLEKLKEIFPNAQGKGDLSFIESLLTDNLHVFHIDSYNLEERIYEGRVLKAEKRFQGVFYYSWFKDNVTSITDNCPIEILKNTSCRGFQLINNTNHIVWTIWFD